MIVCDAVELFGSGLNHLPVEAALLELNRYTGDKYTLAFIESLLPDLDDPSELIEKCVRSKLFRATELIFALRSTRLCDLGYEYIQADLLSIILKSEDEEVWDFFFLANRMDNAVDGRGNLIDFYDRQPAVGTYSYSVLHNQLPDVLFRCPNRLPANVDVRFLRHIQGNADFVESVMSSISVNKNFEVSLALEVYNNFDVSKESKSDWHKYLPFIDEIGHSYHNTKYSDFLIKALKDLMTNIIAGLASYQSLFLIRMNKSVFKETFSEVFVDDLFGFAKILILAAIEHLGVYCSFNFCTSEIDGLICLASGKNLTVKNEMLTNVFESLIKRVFSRNEKIHYRVLHTISYYSKYIVEIPSVCFVDGRLICAALFTFSSPRTIHQAALRRHSTTETFSELFSIPGIFNHRNQFHYPKSILYQLLVPEAILKRILSQLPEPDIDAIVDFYMIYDVAAGKFTSIDDGETKNRQIDESLIELRFGERISRKIVVTISTRSTPKTIYHVLE